MMETLLLIAILEELASDETGLTVGQIHKRCLAFGFAKSKVARLLEKMGEGGLIESEEFQYRSNVISRRYFISEEAIGYFEVIVKKYDASYKRVSLGI